MISPDYKNYIETEIASGMLFDEADYSVDAGEHFELAPNDIVKIDLRPEIQNTLEQMRAIRGATYGQVEVDPDTKEVSVNGNVVSSSEKQAPATVSSGGGANTEPQPNEQPSNTDEIIKFLKMLKGNGSLEKLKTINDDMKKNIADKILGLLKKGSVSKEKTPQEAPVKDANAAKPEKIEPVNADSKNSSGLPDYVQGQADFEAGQDAAGLAREDELLLKEAFIIISELDTQGKNVTAPPATQAPPKEAAPEQPQQATQVPPKAEPTQPSADMPMKDVIAKFKNDEKVVHFNNLEQKFKNLSAIPGAKNRELLAKVEKVNDNTNEVSVRMFQKTDTTPEGKSNFKATGDVFDIPQTSVKKRMPVQQVKKKGLFDRFFGS